MQRGFGCLERGDWNTVKDAQEVLQQLQIPGLCFGHTNTHSHFLQKNHQAGYML
jgi:hypothetical protein